MCSMCGNIERLLINFFCLVILLTDFVAGGDLLNLSIDVRSILTELGVCEKTWSSLRFMIWFCLPLLMLIWLFGIT